MMQTADIVVYGGAAGGGKTWALLLDALRYAAFSPVRGFDAVLFRRTYPQIMLPGGMWDKANELYSNTRGGIPYRSLPYRWEWAQHGTRITFSHLQYDQNVYDYQGSEIPYLGFDELTHFTERQFWYLLSRNRSTCGVRPRVRATTNPDADSWVKVFLAPWVDDTYPAPAQSGEVRWFYREGDTLIWLRPGQAVPRGLTHADLKSATFIEADIYDNPTLLTANPEYLANLKALPLVERQRLLHKDWHVRPSGNMFRREWFDVIESTALPKGFDTMCRFWDIAATEKEGSNDPDYTAGVKMARKGSTYYVLDVVHERRSPAGVDALMLACAKADGVTCEIVEEMEGGSAGKRAIASHRTLLDAYDFHAIRPTANKEVRARPFSSAAEGGRIVLVRAHWNDAYLNELCAFPHPNTHDDQVDASSGAYTRIAEGGGVPLTAAEPETTPYYPGNFSRDPAAVLTALFLTPPAPEKDAEETVAQETSDAVRPADSDQEARDRVAANLNLLSRLSQGLW